MPNPRWNRTHEETGGGPPLENRLLGFWLDGLQTLAAENKAWANIDPRLFELSEELSEDDEIVGQVLSVYSVYTYCTVCESPNDHLMIRANLIYSTVPFHCTVLITEGYITDSDGFRQRTCEGNHLYTYVTLIDD